MKLNKSILTIALGMSVVSLSQAATVYMSGSTAARAVVYKALTNAGTVFTTQPTTTLYKGGGSGASLMAFSGTLVGGSGTTVIKCAWSGSEGGVLDVVSNSVVTESFIGDSALNGIDNGAASPASFDVHGVDVAMADNQQAYSRNKKPVLTTGIDVGIITFKWVRNKGLWTGTNVTDSMIRQAFFGACPRSVFTGVDGQTNDFVYVSGRDNLSGTRVNAFGNSGFGIFSLPYQIMMDNSGVMQSVGGDYAGDFGFSSGGTLATTMGADTTTQADNWNGVTGYSVIAYLGLGDAAKAITAGATELTYNGVPFSAQAVKEGTYTFWGNEWIYKANSVFSTDATTVYNLLANQTTGIAAFGDGSNLIKKSDMRSTRANPVSDPTHK